MKEIITISVANPKKTAFCGIHNWKQIYPRVQKATSVFIVFGTPVYPSKTPHSFSFQPQYNLSVVQEYLMMYM